MGLNLQIGITWFLFFTLIQLGQGEIDCSLDDDQTNPSLDTCLQLGQSFAERYEKTLRKNKTFDQCQEYKKFGDCLRPMLMQCPLLNTTLPHKWKSLIQIMDQACCGERGCPLQLDCMREQYHSIYSQLCRELYDFNILQNTHGKCRFIREKLDCEQSLIASSCGEPVGDLYIALMKASIKKEKCFVPRVHHQTKHFKFSEQCPMNLTDGIRQCAKHHPPTTILPFLESNDLVADARRKQIKNSCNHYDKYSTCVKDLANQCPDGIDKILQFNPKQRAYQLKMDYICQEKRRDYLDNVYCYQEIMSNGSFSKCNSVWHELETYLQMDNMTSYLYYCQPEHMATKAVTRELSKLQFCYEGVIKNSCGEVGAKTMGHLIGKAFHDPHYLRFKYKPDCDLHHPDVQESPVSPKIISTTPPKSSETTTNSKHSSHHKNKSHLHNNNQDTKNSAPPKEGESKDRNSNGNNRKRTVSVSNKAGHVNVLSFTHTILTVLFSFTWTILLRRDGFG